MPKKQSAISLQPVMRELTDDDLDAIVEMAPGARSWWASCARRWWPGTTIWRSSWRVRSPGWKKRHRRGREGGKDRRAAPGKLRKPGRGTPMYRMSRDDRTRKPPQPPERFTKVDDELVALGLPPRLVMLYGKLAYHAFKDGKCFVRHEKLAEEIGLHGKYRDRQVRNLLNQLRHLRLISWRRRRYCNDFDVHDPDRNWISGQTGTGFPLSDRKRISDRKEVKSLKEVPKRRTPTPTPPPSSCAPDGARVGRIRSRHNSTILRRLPLRVVRAVVGDLLAEGRQEGCREGFPHPRQNRGTFRACHDGHQSPDAHDARTGARQTPARCYLDQWRAMERRAEHTGHGQKATRASGLPGRAHEGSVGKETQGGRETDMNPEKVLEICGELRVLRYFPNDESVMNAIVRLCGSMCASEQQVRWLVDRMTSGIYAEWPGIAEMRACFCCRYKPKDGINAYSSVYPNGLPPDPTAPPRIEAPKYKELPPGEPVTKDPELEAAIEKLAAKCKMPPAHPAIDRFARMLREIETPPERREPEEPTPVNPNFKALTQADVDRAVQELHERRAREAEEAAGAAKDKVVNIDLGTIN